MREWSASVFEMNDIKEDGSTFRAQLEKSANGLVPDQASIDKLDSVPDMPEWALLPWNYYCELDGRRVYTMDGPQRFTWGAIRDYQIVTGTVLSTFDLEIIFAIEDEFFKFKADKQ